MKKNISFKLFCTVVWRGLCQGVRALARLFGYQGTDRYMKTVWKMTLGCVCTVSLIFTSALLYVFVDEIVLDEWADWVRGHGPGNITCERFMSNHIAFQKLGYRMDKTRVLNTVTGEVLVKNIDEVYTSNDGDSLAVFFKGDKRGYIDRFTGEIAIPAKYTKAWVFSEGLAAVVEIGELKFIDHNGNTVIGGFEPSFKDESYVFHNGHCFVRDVESGLLGAIDTAGNWIIEPSFSFVCYYNDYILVKKGVLYGLYSSDLQVVLPLEYSDISVHPGCGTILARKGKDGPKLYDLDMNLLSDFVVDMVSHLKYDTGEIRTYVDDDGDEVTENVYMVANSNVYMVSTPGSRDSYGLISKDGIRLTPPIYDGIKAIAPDRYLCSPHGVILNDKGNPVE